MTVPLSFVNLIVALGEGRGEGGGGRGGGLHSSNEEEGGANTAVMKKFRVPMQEFLTFSNYTPIRVC